MFYQKVLPKEIKCVGSGSIVTPDQRFNIDSLINKVISKEICKPSSAVGFAICEGNNIFNMHKISDICLFINNN